MKRFYRQAAVSAQADGTFGIELDGRPLPTPAKAPLALPSERLAQAVADEWNVQGNTVKPEAMPFMTLASTAIDRVIPQHDAVAADIASYAGSDHLCYWADEPDELVALQERDWTPELKWAERRYGVPFRIVKGVIYQAQDNATLMIMAREVASLDSFTLAALHSLTSVYGSMLLALSVLEGRNDAEKAFELSQLDESWQAEQWGWDEEALERRAAHLADAKNAERFIGLLR